jgi:N-methylhydantoinase B
LNVTVRIDPEEAKIELDLLDNVGNVPCGFNESEACATAAVFSGVFNSLDPSVPRNAGSFRRLKILLKDGSVCGRPEFPHSCSLATTNVADRLINLVQAAFAQIGDGFGLAEGGIGMGAGLSVISGKDHRHENEPYVNQIFVAQPGGPGSPSADGWPNYGLPVVAGLMYRDSIEIDELKHPVEFKYVKIVPGSGGAGKYRGSFAIETALGPKESVMDALWPCDGTHYPPKGVRGGADGVKARHWKVSRNGKEEELPTVVVTQLQKRVLKDLLDGFETPERASDVYGVIVIGDIASETLSVDVAATADRRRVLAHAK